MALAFLTVPVPYPPKSSAMTEIQDGTEIEASPAVWQPALDNPPPPESIVPLAPPPPRELVSPQLGPKMSADYDALRNDLEQAQEMAAIFQREVAGKSNELATMRQLLEKTGNDLATLQASIVQI